MKILGFLLLLCSNAYIHAHESYFSFAEMQYDSTCSCLEVTLTLSAHDLEEFSLSKNIIESELEIGLESEITRNSIFQDIILEGFKISQFRKDITLFYEGYELFDDGTCSFYLRSDQVLNDQVTLFYGLFMTMHAEQQNKLSYKNQELQTVFNFFIFKRENEIQL